MENIIKVKLGDIKSQYLDYSMESLLGSEKVSIFKIIKECFFILVFGLVGVLFTILFHNNCFHFFNKYVNSYFLNVDTYKLGNNIFSRILLVIISLLLTINTFLLILYKIIDNLNCSYDYDWAGLYKSLKDNEYKPNKFQRGYVKVEIFKGKYRCSDGNHRHRILLDIYGPDKIIDVIYVGITYGN